MIEIDSGLQQYAEQLDDRIGELAPGDAEIAELIAGFNADIWQKLLSLGVFLPYCDAFAYREKGILLVGDCGVGKSPLSKEFCNAMESSGEAGVSLHLDEDTTSLYSPTDHASAPVVYHDDRIYSEEDKSPNLAPFAYPHSLKEVPVHTIFHMIETNRRGHEIRDGDLAEALDFMFFSGGSNHDTAANRSLISTAFDGIRCFDVFKDKGYFHKEELPALIADVRERMQ